MNYEIVVGLEIHLQPKTKSKMFCSCSADYFGQVANTSVCPVCLGMPGALPVPNAEGIAKCIKMALALNCKINTESKFDRKNYFYPDLPKGYQISQYDLPIGYEGFFEIDVEGDSRRIRIVRVHIEEDTGKSMHDANKTLLDYNKSGMALIEIVTAPDFTDVKEVLAFAKRLRQTVRYLKISDADMEKGQMRFELNMSLRESGKKGLPPYKVEIKNIGSISVLEKVIKFEYERQAEILQKGALPVQETRGLRDLTGTTYAQRVKEEADDYRYFPEPDIPALKFSPEYLQQITEAIGELPQERKLRYQKAFDLDPDLAERLIATLKRADWFEEAIAGISDKDLIKQIAKWLVGELSGLLKSDKHKLSDLKFTPQDFTVLITELHKGNLSGNLAKMVLAEMYASGKKAPQIIADKGLAVISDSNELASIIDEVLAANGKIVADIAKNPNAIKYLLGQVMKASRGKADHKAALDLLERKINS